MSAKHTPEPWHVHGDGCGQIWVDEMMVAICNTSEPESGVEVPKELYLANARRIVAAVNAVAGIPVSALEAGVVGEMLGACKSLINTAKDSSAEVSLGMADAFFKIRDAYAKAKGESP